MRRIILLFLMLQGLVAQNVPFIMDHPVYHFLEQQESRGRIDGEYWSTRPYTFTQINEMLTEIAEHAESLSGHEHRLLNRFQKEFNREIKEDGITFPWSRSTLNSLRRPAQQDIRPFFISYKQGETSGWINFSETIRAQHNGDGIRGYHTDHLGIYGQKGSIAFTTQFTYHRVTKSDHFAELPESHREGYVLERDYMRWISWDYPTSSLTYSHRDFTISTNRQPVYWGYSPDNSSILSDNTNPLPYVEWTTGMKHLRFKFMHARLSPNAAIVQDTSNTRRNLSAHRVEFDISPNFEFAFNEMIVYAHRDFELGYLNPLNFLYTEEHAQGDRDNLLMALDFKWRVIPGLTTYGSWLIDELDWYKLFSGWWGNKFIFQIGGTYYPKANLPSLGMEFTAGRPWTYSHRYPVNSFTSAGRVLGLKAGPNTQTLRIFSSWQVNPALHTRAVFDYVIQGDDPGSDPLNSYGDHVYFGDETASFLLGELSETTRLSFMLDYYLSYNLSLSLRLNSEREIEFGCKFDW